MVGYKPEAIEHSDPVHGLFIYVMIVKNSNGFTTFKGKNTALGFLTWHWDAGRAGTESSVLQSNDLVTRELTAALLYTLTTPTCPACR